MNESQLVRIARTCRQLSQDRITAHDAYNGLTQLDFVTSDQSLKGKHRVDALSERVIGEYIRHINTAGMGPFDLYFEGRHIIEPYAKGSLFVDEVDGSLNMERKTGNPNFIFAYTSKCREDIKLADFEFVFVKSCFTGDEYFASKGQGAKFLDARTGQTEAIRSQGPATLDQAVAYLRPGYGRAREQIVGAYPLFIVVRDIRAFDNTGIELCEIARGAAHLMVDVRSISDTQNLLPYLILKEAGAVLTTEDGKDVGSLSVNENRPFNFIAASNMDLVTATLALLKRYENSGLKEQLSKLTDEIIQNVAYRTA